MSNANEAYRAAGVDLELGNDVSKMLGMAAKQTWDDRQGRIGEIVEYGSGFSSFRGMPLDIIGAKGYILSAGVDGVGTKIEVAERVDDHRTIGHDLVAMSCDDAVVRGGEPFAVANIVDVRTLKDIPDLPEKITQLAIGFVAAARAADVVIINGETAELNDRIHGYGPFNYNWSSMAQWLVRAERIIDNSLVRPGDTLVALREHGFRSNGLSLVRKIFGVFDYEEKGWQDQLVDPEETGFAQPQKLGELVLKPSIIYSKVVVDMTGGSNPSRDPKARIHGAAHITGGGIPEKLGRVLADTGYGAYIEEPFDPPFAMKHAQLVHNTVFGWLSDEAAYRTWNMGQGMVVISPEPSAVLAVAASHGIEAKEIGEVTEQSGIRIRSRGQEQGRLLEFAA